MFFAGCTTNKGYKILVGTYTVDTESKGIYAYNVDAAAGIAASTSVGAEGINPSYLALSPDRQQVYAANEAGQNSAVSAFALDAQTGTLRFINSRQSPDIDPCYIAATPNHIITAGYSSGSITAHRRNEDGSIGTALQTIYRTGNSVNTQRQGSPHIHQTIFTPDQKFLLACDLGTDMVVVYRYNADGDRVLEQVDSILVSSGGGPRHLAINSKGDIAYVLCELDASLAVLSIDANGHLAVLQHTSTATDVAAETFPAAIRLSPDEKFLYATNRGDANSISCFAVDAANGTLAFIEQIPTGGKGPRDFAITPDGNYIFVAHQYTNNITIFERSHTSGKLTATGKEWTVPAPICLVVYK
jgi:6-phosphogluconolactonase